MSSTSDKPSHSMLQDDLWIEKSDIRKDILDKVTKEVVQQFVDLEPRFSTEKKSAKKSSSEETDDDKVYIYSCELLLFGLMYFEFSDAIREADGNRIIRCWRFLMLLFKARQRRNYAIEGLNILTQYHFFSVTGKGNN